MSAAPQNQQGPNYFVVFLLILTILGSCIMGFQYLISGESGSSGAGASSQPVSPPQSGQYGGWPPDGWAQITCRNGICLYQKGDDYVLYIDLRTGASVNVAATYVGNEHFTKKHLHQYADGHVFCAIPGTFYKLEEEPTRLDYSLKVDGQVLVPYGAKEPKYPEWARMLELWPDRFELHPRDPGRVTSPLSAPTIVGLETWDAAREPKLAVGRVMTAVVDIDYNGIFEGLLVLVTPKATQKQAARLLEEWGVPHNSSHNDPVNQYIGMLDGGYSAQLWCDGNYLVATEGKHFRAHPMAIVFIPGP